MRRTKRVAVAAACVGVVVAAGVGVSVGIEKGSGPRSVVATTAAARSELPPDPTSTVARSTARDESSTAASTTTMASTVVVPTTADPTPSTPASVTAPTTLAFPPSPPTVRIGPGDASATLTVVPGTTLALDLPARLDASGTPMPWKTPGVDLSSADGVLTRVSAGVSLTGDAHGLFVARAPGLAAIDVVEAVSCTGSPAPACGAAPMFTVTIRVVAG